MYVRNQERSKPILNAHSDEPARECHFPECVVLVAVVVLQLPDATSTTESCDFMYFDVAYLPFELQCLKKTELSTTVFQTKEVRA